MIHKLLLKLDEILPLYPPLVVALAATLLIFVVWRLAGRSRLAQVILFSLGVGLLAAGLVVGLFGLDRPVAPTGWNKLERPAEVFIGPADLRRWEQVTAGALSATLLSFAAAYYLAFGRERGRVAAYKLGREEARRAAPQRARMCGPRTFRCWSRSDPLGWTLHGRFWGALGWPLGSRLCLSSEDIARGVVVFGPHGSDKADGIILPAIADRMRSGHSLVVADLTGGLQPYVERIAAITNHLLVVHDPAAPSRSISINPCDWVANLSDARAVAEMLLSEACSGKYRAWTREISNLLTGCLLHYPTLGDVLAARQNLLQVAEELAASPKQGIAPLAAGVLDSIHSYKPGLVLDILSAAFDVALAPWTDPAIQAISTSTNLDLAAELVRRPLVVILRCERRHAAAHGPYLGIILRLLVSRLEARGQRAGGALGRPVSIVVDDLPALGRPDILLRDLNVPRQRRITVLATAQSVAELGAGNVGRDETEHLLAGLSTRIVFAGCDVHTAEFFSELTGRRRNRAGWRATAASRHRRALLRPEDLIRPKHGQCTILVPHSDKGRTRQVVLHAELTPFSQRSDWQLDGVSPRPPVKLKDAPSRGAPRRPAPRVQPDDTDLARRAADEIARRLSTHDRDREIDHE